MLMLKSNLFYFDSIQRKEKADEHPNTAKCALIDEYNRSLDNDGLQNKLGKHRFPKFICYN